MLVWKYFSNFDEECLKKIEFSNLVHKKSIENVMFFQFFSFWAKLGQVSPNSRYKACTNTLLGTFKMPAAGCSKNGLLSRDLNPRPTCQSKKIKKYLNAKSTEPPGHFLHKHAFLSKYISVLYSTWIPGETIFWDQKCKNPILLTKFSFDSILFNQ